MAGPVHLTYTGVPGQSIRAGFFGATAPGIITGAVTLGAMVAGGSIYSGSTGTDVVANVWTPSKNSSGNIADASWAQLPINEWCRVASTSIDQVDAALTAGGFNPNTDNYGNSKTNGSFTAWVGCARKVNNVYFPRGGGHADSSLNAVIGLDLEKMGGGVGWYVEKMPSFPNNPTYPWSAAYKAGVSGSWSTYTPVLNNDPENRTVLPDGYPTSMHTYNGVYYDSVRDTINTSRETRWAYSLTNKTWTHTPWTKNGVRNQTSTGAQLLYRPELDRVIGHWSEDGNVYYSWSYTQGNSTEMISTEGVGGSDTNNQGSLCLWNSGQYVWGLWRHGDPQYGESWGYMDPATGIRQNHAPVGGLQVPYTEEMMVGIYVPQWNKVIRRNPQISASWWLFDVATKTNAAWTPAGISVPQVALIGNKAFFYTERNCVVYICPSPVNRDDCVYVMRVA